MPEDASHWVGIMIGKFLSLKSIALVAFSAAFGVSLTTSAAQSQEASDCYDSAYATTGQLYDAYLAKKLTLSQFLNALTSIDTYCTKNPTTQIDPSKGVCAEGTTFSATNPSICLQG